MCGCVCVGGELGTCVCKDIVPQTQGKGGRCYQGTKNKFPLWGIVSQGQVVMVVAVGA